MNYIFLEESLKSISTFVYDFSYQLNLAELSMSNKK